MVTDVINANPICLTAALLAGTLALCAPAHARIISRSAEISVGRETASQVEQFFKVDTDPIAVARVRQIGRRLAAASPDADFPFEFHVVESGEINAFALPGGFIYVFRGLLQLTPNDDALAFVLAHEISHVTRRHAIRQFEKSLLLSAGITAVLAGTGANGFGRAADVAQALAGISFTRGDEADADDTGIRTMVKAGYNPRSAMEAMELVKRAAGDDKSTPALLRTHPAPSSRIKKLDELSKELLAQREAEKTATPPAKPPVAAPEPRLPGLAALEVEPCEWQPLKPDARWTYRTTVGGTETITTARVLEELTGDSAGVFRVEYDLGRGVRAIRLLAPAGDRVLSRADQDVTNAVWRVEGVFAADATVEDRSGVALRTIRLAATEKVRVPAGEFEAARVERLGEDGKPETVLWFARGVGLIKRLTPATGAVQELMVYKIPK